MNLASMNLKTTRREINGFLLLDKSVEMTSNRALQIVKRLFNAKKAGFLGTLDPFATGMLPICFGRATKQVEVLHEQPKTYQATLKLGAKTETGDTEGEISETAAIPELNESEVKEVMQHFVGEIDQVPPAYSAIKKDGVPLYKLARQGIVVERVARKVTINAIQLLALRKDEIEFSVVCGKGTYIRVLAEDLAEKLGTVGHLVALRRLACGGFGGQEMLTLDALSALGSQGTAHLDSVLLPIAS